MSAQRKPNDPCGKHDFAVFGSYTLHVGNMYLHFLGMYMYYILVLYIICIKVMRLESRANIKPQRATKRRCTQNTAFAPLSGNHVSTLILLLNLTMPNDFRRDPRDPPNPQSCGFPWWNMPQLWAPVGFDGTPASWGNGVMSPIPDFQRA